MYLCPYFLNYETSLAVVTERGHLKWQEPFFRSGQKASSTTLSLSQSILATLHPARTFKLVYFVHYSNRVVLALTVMRKGFSLNVYSVGPLYLNSWPHLHNCKTVEFSITLQILDLTWHRVTWALEPTSPSDEHFLREWDNNKIWLVDWSSYFAYQ